MQDDPLLISEMLRQVLEVHRDHFDLACDLSALGVDADQFVSSLPWNSVPHPAAYLAIPAMGAALHTFKMAVRAAYDCGELTVLSIDSPAPFASVPG